MNLKKSDYIELKNGTLRQANVISGIDYVNYWDDKKHSTYDEQKYNVNGFKHNGLTKVQSVLKYAVGNSVFEIGCYPAELLIEATKRGFYAEGIAPEYTYIERMESESGCKVYCGFFPQTKPDKKFDTIISMDVFEHIEDGRAFINGCFDILNENGRLILMSPFIYSDGLFDEKNFIDEHIWIYHENHLKDWLKPIIFDRWIVGHEIIVIENKL